MNQAILTISTYNLKAEREAESEADFDISTIRYFIFAIAIVFVAVWQYKKQSSSEPMQQREEFEDMPSKRGGKSMSNRIANKGKGMMKDQEDQMNQMQDLMR